MPCRQALDYHGFVETGQSSHKFHLYIIERYAYDIEHFGRSEPQAI
jgi:hypothetical protein